MLLFISYFYGMGYEFLAMGVDSCVYFDAEKQTIKKVYKDHISQDDIVRYHSIHSVLGAKGYRILRPSSLQYNNMLYPEVIFSVLDLCTTPIEYDTYRRIVTYPPYIAGKNVWEARHELFLSLSRDMAPWQQLLELFLNEIYDENPSFADYMHHINSMNIKVVPRKEDNVLQFVVTDMWNSIPRFLQSYYQAQKEQELLDILAKNIKNPIWE